MAKTTNLKQQLEAFTRGQYLDSSGINDTTCYNFYDWFCKDSSLKNKATKLFKHVSHFVTKMKIDTENTYVFFKNNCPMRGPLYDDFRICDLTTGEVLWNITPKSGHSNQAEIWGRINNFKEPLAQGKTLNEIYKNNSNYMIFSSIQKYRSMQT
jgi:hypothetical protein